MHAGSAGYTTDRDSVRKLPLVDVAQRCRDAASRFERGQTNPGDEYCYELFRRAISERDDDAWQAVFAQYSGLVIANVRRHPWGNARRHEDAFWINATFERFWKAIGPDRFEMFADLAALLGYLKMCTHSAIVNELRAGHGMTVISMTEAPEESAKDEDVAGVVLDEIELHGLWDLIEAELHDDRERLLARLSFVLDFKPGEIHEQHPEHFPTIGDVYRIKRNVIDRLRRSPQIKNFLE